MKFQRILKYLFLLIFLLAMVNCDKIEVEENLYGLVLTVDDGYIDEWYEYLDYLESHNAKLTFYIVNYPSLSFEEKTKLKAIAKRGHEIAFHGTNHVSVITYLQNHTFTEYMNDEIIEGLDAMKKDSFTINHFAYPYGESNSTIDTLLLGYFTSIRKLDWTDENIKLKNLDAIHYSLPCTPGIIRAAGIDNGYNVPLKDITEAIDSIAITREALMLYCHKLSNDSGAYNIPVEKMKGIIEHCSSKDVPMIKVNDMYSEKSF